MQRVPHFLPDTIFVYTSPNRLVSVGAIRTGNDVSSAVVVPTMMRFVMYSSPAIINGLLMTEVMVPDKSEVQRFFFGYRCSICETVFLVSSRPRREYEVVLEMGHPCESSELRRAVRNAREMGRERGEYIMEGPDGRWWPERHDNAR